MKTPIIILHGWKKQGSDYYEIKNMFEKKGFEVFAPDMPGFGVEMAIKPVMKLDDYVEFVNRYLLQRKLKKVILLGHSFGGRVAAKFAVKYPDMVEKIVLTGAPLIKRKLSMKKRAASIAAKTGKRVLFFLPESIQQIPRKLLYRSIGEYDYLKSGDLRKTFVNIIGEDLAPVLPKITMPTLLVWGEQETFVPVADGQEIAKRIPKSQFVLLRDAGHTVPYDNPQEFALAVLPFLE